MTVCCRSGRTEWKRVGAGLMSMNTPWGSASCSAVRSSRVRGAGPSETKPEYSSLASISERTSEKNDRLIMFSIARSLSASRTSEK